MKIFVLGARGFPNVQGGIESHCEALYPRISHKYEIVALVIKGYINLKVWQGIKLIHIPSVRSRVFQKPIYNLISALYCLLHRPNIIHIHGLNSGFFIWLLRLFGLKVVVTYHSQDYTYPKWSKPVKLMLRFSELQFLLANHIICVSKNYIEHFRTLGRQDKISYIPNGFNRLSQIETESSIRILSKWQLQSGQYILFVGRITPEKDILTLIRAFKECNLNDMKLVIVGDADFQDEYYNILKKEMDNNIIFTGFLNKNDITVLYKNCRLFVLPSLYEGLPIALLEAMAYNCSILVSNIDAHIAIGLEPDDYFKAGDLYDLVQRINIKIQKGKNSNYINLLKEYDWGIITDKVIQIYENLNRK